MKFDGKPGVEHRAFVISADLLNQEGTEPWRVASSPDPDVLATGLSFMTSRRAASDVVIAFDGCMRAPRRKLDDAMETMQSGAVAEVTIIYDKSWNSWCQRRFVLSSSNKEVGYVALPVSRARMTIKDGRQSFCGAGEGSNHYCTYTGVQMPLRTGLARITAEEKNKVFKSPEGLIVPDKWVKQFRSGVPLFWHETKPAAFWVQLLQDLHVTSVIDLSPGSGVLANACMSCGISYFGICSNIVHQQWLSNVIDREALQYIAKSGTFLYQEDLATHVNDLFSDMLRQDGDDEARDGDADITLEMSDTQE